MNNQQKNPIFTSRISHIVLALTALIIICGLIAYSKYADFRETERREQKRLEHECLITDQIHAIKTSQRKIEVQRSEIEAHKREAVQSLKEIMDTQAHFETEHHSAPDIEVQRTKLARERKNAEAQVHELDQLLAQCDRMLAQCDEMLAKCNRMLQNLAD